MKVGNLLKNIRKMKKLTQTQIGKQLSLNESTISNYETGYITPTFETVKKFADICNFEIQFKDKKNNRIYTIEELSKEMDF